MSSPPKRREPPWWRRALCALGLHPTDEVEDHGRDDDGRRLVKCYVCGHVGVEEPWWKGTGGV
jgi:hypothetical protein